jgi:hypothetical protein
MYRVIAPSTESVRAMTARMKIVLRAEISRMVSTPVPL